MFSGHKSQQTDSTTQQHLAGLPAYITERIRQLYQVRERQLKPFTWCDYPNFNLNDIFTRLKIRNREKTRGTLTDDEITNMTAIFRPHPKCQEPRIVLIEGDPGMGKTTYSQKLAYDWANKQYEWDESFPVIEVLLLLRCNDIKTSIEEAIDDQILPRDIDKEAKETFFKYIKENESKVLLLLDGLDEADSCKQEMFLLLVQSRFFPACHIVITSRHEDGKEIRPYCDTLWEIVGFTKEDSKSFIRKYFQGKDHLAENLIKRVDLWYDYPTDDNRGFADLMKNPLNVALICSIFEDSEHVFSKSRTRLYIEIALLVLRRYEEKYGLASSHEDLISVYRKELLLLGSFALDSLRKGELYFEKNNDIVNAFNFGFLSFQQGGTRSKPCTRCAFLHKSFQEFFAGLYLAFQIIDGQTDFAQVLTDERYLKELKEVLLFMSGIIASNKEETGESIFISMAEHISGLLRTSDQKVKSYMTLACSCLVEYFLSLTGRHFNEKKGVTTPENTFGMHLDMSSLTKVDLSTTDIQDAGAAAISVVLENNSSLTYLDLSFNNINGDGAFSLSKALTENSSLISLKLSFNNISDVGASALSQALTANSTLHSLDLSGSGIGDAGASFLSTALTANSSLTRLDLSANSIGDAGASSLSTALTVNSSLTHLDLSANSIGDAGASSLSTALTANSTLHSLNLSQNRIGDAGASSLSKALTAISTLHSLDLSYNRTGDAGASSLSSALVVNSTLHSLDLSNNSIGAVGAYFLSDVLKFNSTLTRLNLHGNGIGEVGAFFLSKTLTANSSLTTLDLSDNGIGDVGASCLSQALSANSSLETLDLTDNSVGVAGAASFNEASKINKKVDVRF
ncbi:uncharacterized protein [Porites lutea]|uniref:uncharacterized protein n=1 Tax=Porites lutea TaxID=51062 RepID=UPI003CC55E61